MSELRAAVTTERQSIAGREIIEKILSGKLPIPAIEYGSVLALYVSDGGEPDFMPCLPMLLRKGIVCCFPAFREGHMVFCAPVSAEDFSVGAFGIREPGSESRLVDGRKIDVILVPGLAFDRSGARLGRGKGFYDRYLLEIDPENKPITIGTGYDFQLVEDVPSQPGDVPMDLLVTA
jgi:5-formyltetrahydrofolate cyclo-ligase